MKRRSKLAIIAVLLVVAGVAIWFGVRGHRDAEQAHAPARSAQLPIAPPSLPHAGSAAAVIDPLPGQGRAVLAADASAGGVLAERVVNWSTGGGVGDADLTFASDTGALTVRSNADGTFELAPPAPGDFTLATIAAPGFLPYAPEYEHSTIHVRLAKQQAVRGITVFLFPAVDYHGLVVDAGGHPVAGAHVKLLGTPTGEQAIDKLATEWTTGKDGRFDFHAADDAVFEATHGKLRGWARLDRDAQITHEVKIALRDAPAHDATISGKVIDDTGAPLPDVLVTAEPYEPKFDPDVVRATVFATSAADGTFVLEHVDRRTYELVGEVEGHATARQRADGGATNVTLAVATGVVVAGTVVNGNHEPVPAFTIAVFRRQGAARGFELARSIVDPRGRFELHVAPGDIELVASAAGWAPTQPKPIDAKAAVRDIELVVSTGGTLRGMVVDAKDHTPIPYARVMREARGGGASPQPANAGTVTRADGSFELTGIPPGPVSVEIAAGEYHPKIEGGMVARDGETIGPITFGLNKLAPGEAPTLELVGIGIALTADGDALLVTKVFPGGGAEAAGIASGDHVVAVDGAPAKELGVDGAVQRIRGVAGTTVVLTLDRDHELVPVTVERRPLKA